MNTYLIYKITCLVTNKVYIGQVVAKPMAERFERHIKTAFDDNNDFSKIHQQYRIEDVIKDNISNISSIQFKNNICGLSTCGNNIKLGGV